MPKVIDQSTSTEVDAPGAHHASPLGFRDKRPGGQRRVTYDIARQSLAEARSLLGPKPLNNNRPASVERPTEPTELELQDEYTNDDPRF